MWHCFLSIPVEVVFVFVLCLNLPSHSHPLQFCRSCQRAHHSDHTLVKGQRSLSGKHARGAAAKPSFRSAVEWATRPVSRPASPATPEQMNTALGLSSLTAHTQRHDTTHRRRRRRQQQSRSTTGTGDTYCLRLQLDRPLSRHVLLNDALRQALATNETRRSAVITTRSSIRSHTSPLHRTRLYHLDTRIFNVA